jgi:hypothetical protein
MLRSRFLFPSPALFVLLSVKLLKERKRVEMRADEGFQHS